MENQPYLLVELEDLSTIFNALKTTSRIKYTCFNVSNNYLIFGATSGGLYLFRREPCCFLQILPNKEGSVTQVAFSPDEKLIAFSTVKGLVCVLEKSSHGGKHLVTTSEHQNEQVTCLQWNEGSSELFIGDQSGKVSIVTISVFTTKSMFQNPSFVLMQLESKIVQMDFSSNMLLVSTLTKCYICDTTKEIFKQVGHKLRDGEYGACIIKTQTHPELSLNSSKSESDKNVENVTQLKILCARPGSRIWEVSMDGTVISTHHFKEALAVAPKKIIFLHNSHKNNSEVNYNILANGGCERTSNIVEQSFNFQKLLCVLPNFFLTYKSDGIYIFDPERASVVLWNNEITSILDVKCVSDVIYVWSNSGKIYALHLVPLEKFLVRLYFQKKYLDLATLCVEYETFLLNQANNCSKLHVLHDLDEKLKHEEFKDRLRPLINICKENLQKRKSQNAQRLQTGIYLVSNNDQMLLEGKQKNCQKYLRPNYLNLKGRSHSVSPERLQNGELKHQGSCSSLPDLMKNEKIVEISSPSSEVVVNGKKVKEPKLSLPKMDTKNVCKILETITGSIEPSKETVFSLLNEILALNGSSTLSTVTALPFDSCLTQENIKVISDVFHSSLKSKILFEWFSGFSGDWVSVAVKNYPSFLVQHVSEDDLALDFKLSKTLKLFADILNEKDIFHLIKKLEMKCYYASFCVILEIYQDSAVSNLNLSEISSTSKLLNTAYFLVNVGQIDQCSKYSNQIDLQDMFYLILKFENKSCKSTKSAELIELQSHTMFLSYLDKSPDGKKLIVSCSDLVEIYAVDCLEHIVNTASRVIESHCDCGFPSHSCQSFITMFPSVGHALLDKNWPKNPDRCMKICGRVPYLWKYLVYLRKSEPLLNLLPFLVQIGDTHELENRSEEITENVMEICLQLLVKLKKGICLNCGNKLSSKDSSISWSVFGTLCIKFLGPNESLELFEEYSNDISSKELDQMFYQSLIFSTIMERHSKGLRKNVVDLLTGKGSDEPNRMSIFSEKLSEEIMGIKNSANFSFRNTKLSSHHWGAKVNFKSNCIVCSLPLETKVLISEAGLVVFKCAHVFHSACLKKGSLECPVCVKKSQTRTLSEE